MAQCLTPECEHKANWRGVCWSCRDRIKRALATGKVTEADLMKYGLLKQLQKPHGKRASRTIYSDLDKLKSIVTRPVPLNTDGTVQMNEDGSFTFNTGEPECPE